MSLNITRFCFRDFPYLYICCGIVCETRAYECCILCFLLFSFKIDEKLINIIIIINDFLQLYTFANTLRMRIEFCSLSTMCVFL